MRRYEILGDIASGGMGVVSVARLHGERGFVKLVAIKRIHPHLSQNSQFHDLLAREAQLAARVRHPTIVQVHELTTQDDELMLVMDYVEGTSLRRVLDGLEHLGESLPLEVAVRIGIDAARGLEAMHSVLDDDGHRHGVVHRDVSPQNVMVSFQGEVKLMDFGIATALEADHGTTSTVRGKPAYLAPEQLRGERADARADLWALGVMLWEMLAGQRLFRGANDFETVQRVQDGPLLRLDEVDGEQFSRALADTVASALTRDRDLRVSSAHVLASRLEAACPEALTLSRSELARWTRRAVPEEEARLRALTRQGAASSLRPPAPRDAVSRVPHRITAAAVGLLVGFVGLRATGLHASNTPPVTSPAVTTQPLEAVPPRAVVVAPAVVPSTLGATPEDDHVTVAPTPSVEQTPPPTSRRVSTRSTRRDEPPRTDREGSSTAMTAEPTSMAPAVDPHAPMTEFPL